MDYIKINTKFDIEEKVLVKKEVNSQSKIKGTIFRIILDNNGLWYEILIDEGKKEQKGNFECISYEPTIITCLESDISKFEEG